MYIFCGTISKFEDETTMYKSASNASLEQVTLLRSEVLFNSMTWPKLAYFGLMIKKKLF